MCTLSDLRTAHGGGEYLLDTHTLAMANSRERHDDEVGPVVTLRLHQVGDQADGLDGLAQTHLVSQDPIQVVVVQ